MSTMERNQELTVHCPLCQVPMHLPNRALLGCKALCWHCRNTVLLLETRSEPPANSPPPELPGDVEQSEGDLVPDDLWEEGSTADSLEVPSTLRKDADALQGEQ